MKIWFFGLKYFIDKSGPEVADVGHSLPSVGPVEKELPEQTNKLPSTGDIHLLPAIAAMSSRGLAGYCVQYIWEELSTESMSISEEIHWRNRSLQVEMQRFEFDLSERVVALSFQAVQTISLWPVPRARVWCGDGTTMWFSWTATVRGHPVRDRSKGEGSCALWNVYR